MEIQSLDWWYHRQFESYYDQIVALFSGFQYQTGVGRDGTTQLRSVPCKMALYDKQVSSIIRNNSDNTLNAVPQISIWPVNVTYNPKRMQDPLYTQHVPVYEKKIDPVTNTYSDHIGNSYMVERYMPAIFELVFQVDIWTSNMDQKYQLLEQILTTTVPCINLQTSSNPIDWSSLSFIEFKDLTLTSRSIPIGTSNDIDIASIQYQTVVNLNLPAKVTRLNVIDQIGLNIYKAKIGKLTGRGKLRRDDITKEEFLDREIVTLGDFSISVEGNEVTLMTDDPDMSWQKLCDLSCQQQKDSEYTVGFSTIRLRTTADIENRSNDVWGTFEITEDPKVVLITYDISSLPANTLKPVNAIIDPSQTFPGKNLPIPVNGVRYLLTSDIPSGGTIWNGFYAKNGDIIEYNGQWNIVWTADNQTQIQYVLNLYSGIQLKWAPDYEGWRLAIDHTYNPGYWSLVL